MAIFFKPSPKQEEIFDLFEDDETTEVVYGGSLASGKTYLLASLLIMKCLQYDGIRVGLGRETLSDLKGKTLTSFFECLNDWELIRNTHYTYNGTTGVFTFENGSEIILIELSYYPSDPEYSRIGGLLLTFAAIDEASGVNVDGKQMLQSRLGRWKNDNYNIKPILLMTCNPSRNFIYREFYIPFRDGTLKDHQKFVQALPSDNPYLPKGYIENLERTLSIDKRKRLLLGLWEFGDDDTNLFKEADIELMYDTSIILSDDRTMRLSSDIAFTTDKCVFVVWCGLNVTNIITFNKVTDGTVVDKIKEICLKYKIKTNNVSFDADGVGKYISQYLPSAREIHNGGKTLKNHGYRNLKTELYFKLSDMVASGDIKISTDKYKKEISEELSVIKEKVKDDINKIEINSKGDMKRVLGRSPDYADALAYGMIFQLRGNTMTSSDFITFDM